MDEEGDPTFMDLPSLSQKKNHTDVCVPDPTPWEEG